MMEPTLRCLLKIFPVSEAAEAFRHTSQGKHIGKNVLDFELPDIRVASCTQVGHLFISDGTYLITGGTGGFGFEVAQWMVANGARNLVFMSRSGPREKARGEIEILREKGVAVVDAKAGAAGSQIRASASE
jgi:hypothetical protein